MYIRNVPNEEPAAPGSPSISEDYGPASATDNRLDYWFDDDDYDEERGSMYVREKTNGFFQPKGVKTFDFLSRLTSASKSRGIIHQSRDSSLNLNSMGNLFRKQSESDLYVDEPELNNQNPFSDAKYPSSGMIRPQNFDLLKEQFDDYHIPYPNRTSPSHGQKGGLRALSLRSSGVMRPNMRRDQSPDNQAMSAPVFETIKSDEEFGSTVYVLPVQDILAINKDLAFNYR
jgi:hypothetical protein